MTFRERRFFAHPNEELILHLENTGKMARYYVREQGVTDEKILKLAELTGKSHDIGKYTHFFQNSLNKKERKSDLTSHAPISAAYCNFAIRHALGDEFLAGIGSISVYKHHGDLDFNFQKLSNFAKEFEKPFENYVKEQIDSLDKNKKIIDEELGRIGMPPISQFISEVRKNMLCEHLLGSFKALSQNKDVDGYFRLQLIYSSLLNSDKILSAGINLAQNRPDFERNYFDEWKPKTLSADYLKELRDEVYSKIRNSFLSMLDRETLPHIYTIMAPTGSGKTRAALSLALELRSEVVKRYGYCPRIIYCLPFINIIEQTYSEVEQVLKDQFKSGEQALNRIILKQHSYSLVSNSNDENIPLEEKLLLAQTWESEIIITTFVQLLETLIGNKSSMLIKFNKIYGSIIIMDEVQAIDNKFWPLVKRVISDMSKHSFFILMSATLPRLLVPDEAVNLTEDNARWYQKTDRVKFEYKKGTFSIESLSDFVMTELNNAKSIAIILNKIKESVDLYRLLKNKLCEKYGNQKVRYVNEYTDLTDEEIYTAYLSTNLVPKHRMEVIQRIKAVLESPKTCKLILVCTQVIEAGLDIDFDIVIRDMAPLDSIVQSAGRCNRNAIKGDGGSCYIVEVAYEGKNTYSTVYGEVPVEATKNLLNSTFKERDLPDMIRRYYEELKTRKAIEENECSRQIIEAMSAINMADVGKFKLICEPEKASVLVEIDKEAVVYRHELEDLISRWKEACNQKDLNEIMNLRAKIKLRNILLSNYVIDTYFVESLPEALDPVWKTSKYVSSSELEKYYDKETGLKIRDEAYGNII